MVIFLLACDVSGSVEPRPVETGHDPDDSAEVIGESGDPGSAIPVFEPAPYVPDAPDVTVDCLGAGDFRTLREAIAASTSGTKIGVAPCTYRETVNFGGEALDIFSLQGAETTIIDGEGSGPLVVAARGEGPGTRLAGFTLTGGRSDYASAVYVDTAMLALDHVLITGNQDAYSVIYGSGAAIDLVDVRMEANDVSREGAPIVTDNGYMRAERFYLSCGDSPYGVYQHNVTLLLDSEIACEKADYALVVGGGELHARRSRIVGGQLGIYGEDNPDTRNERLWLYNTAVVADGTAAHVSFMHLKVENSVFHGGQGGLTMASAHIESYAYNSAFSGGSCPLQGDGTAFLAGWNGYENGEACRVDAFSGVAGDLGFVNAPADFRLVADSRLVDAGNPDDAFEDADGTRCDVGIYAGPGWAGLQD